MMTENAQKSKSVHLWIWVAILGVVLVAAFFLMDGPPEVDEAQSPQQDAPPAELSQVPQDESLSEEIVEVLEAKRQELDDTVWKQEVIAQEYESAFIELWDDLRSSDDKYDVFASFDPGKVQLGELKDSETIDWGIDIHHFGGPGRELNFDQWREFLLSMKDKGYEIIETEWHHANFQKTEAGGFQSTVSFEIHIVHPENNERFIVGGPLTVTWSDQKSDRGYYMPAIVDATNLEIRAWKGPQAFELDFQSEPYAFGPVFVYDLNRDGFSDLIVPNANRVYMNEMGQGFGQKVLTQQTLTPYGGGILADFTGDGNVDFLCSSYRIRGQLLYLYPGDENGEFGKAQEILHDQVILEPRETKMTAGDIDKDGDLDLWVAQYKQPYDGGEMPEPYYDANDGFPSYLLVNNGNGEFEDQTEDAGLGPKRFRRTYSTSFVDLDDDGDLDLTVVCDFAGLDIHFNDGQGQFTDVTGQTVDETANFGMSQTFADFNMDGKLDFYVTGMGSTTARRLEKMGLGREDFPDIGEMRMKMGYGNRMYLHGDGHTFAHPEFNDQVARTGWSWGSTNLDFDLDGDRDLFVVNGHVSGETARDYCTYFWCHDVYPVKASEGADLISWADRSLRPLKEGISWNGFEKNQLIMNLGGKRFVKIGFLMGVASVNDSRQAVSDDLNNDGKPDLIVAEIVKREQKLDRSAPILSGFAGDRYVGMTELRTYENEWHVQANWIGVNLYGAPGVSPIGARITLSYPGGRQVLPVVTGDSYWCQHANKKHFGLGQATTVDWIEIKWPNGDVQRVEQPEINKYHTFKPQAS